MSRPVPTEEAAWARPKAFAAKPDEGPYGLADAKGNTNAFESLDELKSYLDTGRGRLALVWHPGSKRLVAPEELSELAPSLRKRRLIFAQEDEDDFRKTLPFTGLAALFGAYVFFTKSTVYGFEGLDFLVLTVFVFLYFTARPWWEARKGRRSAKKITRKSLAEEVPEARFELWLDQQKTPYTIALMGLLLLVGLTQFFTPELGINKAGFNKEFYPHGARELMFTGAFLHGNLIHFILNASALWYLGRRVEILAKWPQLALVFFLSILGSGWATLEWIPKGVSVGISGVVCGLLGFLLVFETLHRRLVPRPARRRLAAILISLVVIGILGFRFIDNAAHFGGLATGAVVAFVIFPKSTSPTRPRILWQDYLFGGAGSLLILASAVGAVVLMVS